MKNNKNDYNSELSAENFTRNPETVDEMLNSYGTYNIQPTAATDNDFPAIAQGENKRMQGRPERFSRSGDDCNPASDETGKKAF